MSKTLRDLAGTGRGLGNLTVEDLRALLDSDAPAKTDRKAEKKAAKARAAKAAKSEFYRDVIVGKREERIANKSANSELATWMRSKGLVPTGQAWAAAKGGDRSVKRLLALNAADGHKPTSKGRTATSKEAKVEAPVRVAEPAKAKKAKAEKVQPTALEEAVEALVLSGSFSEKEARDLLGA